MTARSSLSAAAKRRRRSTREFRNRAAAASANHVPEQISPADAAQSLVDRGLADPIILWGEHRPARW